jgi:hypothetical protein
MTIDNLIRWNELEILNEQFFYFLNCKHNSLTFMGLKT